MSLVEHTFVRLIYTLSHHPDFSCSLEDICMFTSYIQFFLVNVANQQNVSYLYHMAAKIKTAKDVVDESNEAIHVLCELAQYLIKEFSGSHGYSLTSYNGNPKLPKDLFVMERGSKVQELANKVFLPDEFIKTLSHKPSKTTHLDSPKKETKRETKKDKEAAVDKKEGKRKRKAKKVESESENESGEEVYLKNTSSRRARQPLQECP
jgi:sister-chromatid-cohesion protein PDS5